LFHLHDIFGPTFNVKDGYGAVGNGTADDTAAINAALAALAAAGGGRIYFPSGTYKVTAPIPVNTSNTVFAGNGTIQAAGTEPVWNGDRGILELGISTPASNIGVVSLVFSIAGLAQAISIYGGSNFAIRRCRFAGASTGNAAVSVSPGLGVGGSGSVSNVAIDGNDFGNTGTIGVRLYSASGRTVSRTRIVRNDFNGQSCAASVGIGAVFLDAADTLSGTVIANNTFKDLVGHAVGSGGYANAVGGGLSTPGVLSDTIIANNHYSNTRGSQRQGFVHLYQAARTTISGNIATGGGPTCEGPFFAPGRTANPMIDVKVIGNSVDSFDAFWDPDSMRFVEVADNIVRNCGAGLTVGYDTQQYIKIHDNLFYNSCNAAYPAAIVFGNATSIKVDIHDNTIIDDRGTPVITKMIELTGGYDFSDATIRNNRVYVPSATLAAVVFKEMGTEVAPRVLRDNELHDGAGARLLNGGGTPSIAVGANAGTGATVSIVGDDRSGTITVNSGTGPAGGTYATVTFAVPYAAVPAVVLTAANGNAVQQPPYVTAAAATFAVSTAAALGASTTFKWAYTVTQR
jgi:hypothetical protein